IPHEGEDRPRSGSRVEIRLPATLSWRSPGGRDSAAPYQCADVARSTNSKLNSDCERFRRRQFRRIKISPVPVLATKSRDPAFRGNTRTGDYKNAHANLGTRLLGTAALTDHLAPITNHSSAYSHPIWRPLFCCSSQLC